MYKAGCQQRSCDYGLKLCLDSGSFLHQILLHSSLVQSVALHEFHDYK